MLEAAIKNFAPQIRAYVDKVKIPSWVGPAAEHAVELAEVVGGTGAAKKERAKATLRAIGKAIDIPGVPEPLEGIIENLVIDAAIELAWSMRHGPKSAERRAARRREQS